MTWAASCCGHRENGIGKRRQFTGIKLTFNLQPNEEKKDRHQSIVDPLLYGQVQVQAGKGQIRFLVPEVRVGFAPAAVGYGQRHNGAAKQKKAANPFTFKKTGKKLCPFHASMIHLSFWGIKSVPSEMFLLKKPKRAGCTGNSPAFTKFFSTPPEQIG